MTLDHTDNAGERVLYNGIGHTSVICVCTCLLFWFATSLWCKLKIVAIKTLIADFAMIIRVPSQNLQQWPLTENVRTRDRPLRNYANYDTGSRHSI